MNILVVHRSGINLFRTEGERAFFKEINRSFRGSVKAFFLNAYPHFPELVSYASFDAIILHASILGLRYSEREVDLLSLLSPLVNYSGPIVALPQDEYDCYLENDRVLAGLGVEFIFTCYPRSVRKLYPSVSGSGATFRSCLAGYVSKKFVEESRPIEGHHRQVDIVYRGSSLGSEFGELGSVKTYLPGKLKELFDFAGVTHDIAVGQSKFIKGRDWYAFLRSGRAAIGFQSGSDLMVANMKEKREKQYVRFSEGGTISARHLECAALGVPQILLEGAYGGYLVADTHYIPLKKDLSNIDDIISDLKCDEKLLKVGRNARRLICSDEIFYLENHVAEIISVINARLKEKNTDSGNLGVCWFLRVHISFVSVVNYFNIESVINFLVIKTKKLCRLFFF